MKIRTGFVTNSSSSSFIVLFNKPINSKQDMLDIVMKNIKSDEDCQNRFECDRINLAEYLYDNAIGYSNDDPFHVYLSAFAELVNSDCMNGEIEKILFTDDFETEIQYFESRKYDPLIDVLTETSLLKKFKDIPNMRTGHLHYFDFDNCSRVGENIQDFDDMEFIIKDDGEILDYDS